MKVYTEFEDEVRDTVKDAALVGKQTQVWLPPSPMVFLRNPPSFSKRSCFRRLNLPVQPATLPHSAWGL